MAKSNTVIKKTRGRPATGVGEMVGVRLHDPLLSAIDDWCAKQRPIPGRPEAIRRLVSEALGLKD